MEEKIISTRIDRQLHGQMKQYDEINWSAVIRKALIEKMKKIEREKNEFDIEKMKNAARIMDELAEKNAFRKGKSSTEIIRKWRDKRKF